MNKSHQLINLVLFTLLLTAAAFSVPAQSDEQKCNCVLFARSMVRSLPTGLDTLGGKLNVINHRFPRVGSVAVMDVGSYGHVGVVENVSVQNDGSLSVSIVEANYSSCQITRRTDTLERLRIRGFYDPNVPRRAAFPSVNGPLNVTARVGSGFTVDAFGTGFDAGSIRAVVLGGTYCNSWNRCVIPTDVIQNRTAGSASVPMVLNGTGRFTVYLFNASTGLSSNAIRVTVR